MSKINANKKTIIRSTQTWKHDLIERAKTLETEAQLSRVAAMADTPEDGNAAVLDLVVSAMHRAATRIAKANGNEPPPRPPAPVSKLLTRFHAAVTRQLEAVSEQLTDDERRRLAAVGPAVIASIDASDKTVIEDIASLLQLPAEWAAAWLRGHLDEIEARFAS